MYYYDGVLTDIEDLIRDFLEYRKNKKNMHCKIQSQYEVGKGWPYTKGYNLKISKMDMPNETTEPTSSEYNYDTHMPILNSFPNPLNESKPKSNEENDEELTELLLGEINKMLMPYIKEVLNEYEYEGSPVYDEQMDKETFMQIIGKVIEKARKNIYELDEIMNEQVRNVWVGYKLINAIVEALIINELFFRRRPIYRMMYADGWRHNIY